MTIDSQSIFNLLRDLTQRMAKLEKAQSCSISASAAPLTAYHVGGALDFKNVYHIYNAIDAVEPQDYTTLSQVAARIQDYAYPLSGNPSNFITSESDPTVPDYVKGITSAYFAHGETAYSWGNHALAGYTTLPSQTGNAGKYLTTNGTSLSWGAGSSVSWGTITGTLSNQTDLQNALDTKVNKNADIVAGTHTKITYDLKGLVISGTDATTSDIAEGSNLYFTEPKVRNTPLTGLSLAGSTISSTDTIIQALGKLQNQVTSISGGVNYQGSWNAFSNSPVLSSSTGTKGYYYVVSTPGITNLDGITDWKTGDWAIFNGTVWQKIDNTDAVISVNGYLGVVSLVTADIAESGNLYFTVPRVLASTLTGYASGAGTITSSDSVLSAIQKLNGNDALKVIANSAITGATKTKITYDSKGLVTAGSDLVAGDIPDLSSIYSIVGHTHTFASLTSKPTTLSGYGITDAQSQLNGTGFVKASGTTITYDNSSYSLTTHNHSLDSLSNVTITSNATNHYLGWSGTAWVNRQIAYSEISGTPTISYPVSSVFGRTGAVVAATNDYTFAQIGSKPTTLSGYGITDAVPSTRTITINGTTLDLSANRSWTISAGTGSVTSVSVVSANGFAGTVATSTTTPAITLSTTITGLIKGDGTSLSAATAGIDYATPSTAVTGLTAAGTTQGTALVLSGNNSLQEITTTASGTGVQLPVATSSSAILIVNRGANALLVYPATSGIINGQASNAAYTLPANSTAWFIGKNSTSWYTDNSFQGGDVNTTDSSNSLTIGAGKVTNTMLAGSIASSKLVGSDISTIGTITTGTWNGTIIAGQYGGTGVNNSGKTITLGGNFTTSGAFGLTFTISALTNVTLPTTGTLSTLAGAETFTNKDLASGTNTFPTFNQNTTGSATTLTTGRTISTTGDVTWTSGAFNGSANVTGAATVTRINGIALSGLATGILKNTTTTGVLSIAVAADFPTLNQNTTGTASNVTGTVAIGNGGTGQITAAAAFNALSPVTLLGDLIYGTGANTNGRLAGNITATKNFLVQTGNGSVSAAPSWGTISAADIPTLNQNTTGTAGSVSGTNVITNSNLAQMAANTIKGNNTAGTANAGDLTVTQVKTMLSLNNVENTALSTWTGSTNITTLGTIPNLKEGYTTTTTAAGTTTLTVASNYQQYFTGTTTQTVVLPVASTLTLGQSFEIVNNSTGLVTVNSSGGNAVVILAGSTTALVTCILTSGTTAASWSVYYAASIVTSAKKLSVSNTLTLAGTDGTTMTFPSTSATIARTDAAQTFTGVQTFVAPILGTPTSVTLTNATGLPVSTGISGLGTNVATFLGTPSSANLAAAMTDETGSGSLVFSTSATLTTPTTKNVSETQQTLTDGATINWDMNSGGYATVTLGGNRTIANPTNTRNGATYILEVIQDGTGSRTVTWGTNFIWSGGTAPTLTTTVSKRDFITFVCSNGKLYGVATPNFA